ncbi:hypothetical protein POP12_027 [Pectobacterium phage POP12]|nr:hypothetical protein POP12_027 [Pectobacterium phage POP12]
MCVSKPVEELKMNPKYKLRQILSVMIDIKLKRNRNIIHGICDNVNMNVDFIIGSWLKDSFESFGLDRFYPVEAHVFKGTDIDPEEFHCDCYDMYDPETECGKFRLELLDRLIEKASNEIEV